MSQTVRQATRRLLRARGFSIAAILTLTLGIGATTAVFSIVNAVLLRPLPYASPDQLVDLSHTLAVSGVTRVDQSDATYLFYRRANRVFADVGVYRTIGVNVGRLDGATSGDTRAERVPAARVSASTLTVLGATPIHGRAFRENEDRPDAPPVVLLAQRLWERKYGADPAIIGRQLEVDGVQREVVGILPADFDLPSTRTDVWVPIGIDPANTASAAFDYRGVGRLRPGVTLAAATADLQSLLPRMPEAFPGRLTAAAIEQTNMRAVVRPLRDVVVGDIGRVLWVVLGAVAFVLLIACANVMNLFLVRAEGRHHELAVRRALGASRATLVREHVIEGAILAVIGVVFALGLAAGGVSTLRSLEGAIDIPRLAEVRIDGIVLGVAIAVTAVAVLLVSVIPALRAMGTSASSVLNEASRSMTAGRRRHRARHTLVVAQLALALVLLVGAGLMARSFARLRAVPAGVDAEHAFVFRVALPRAGYRDVAATSAYIARAMDAIRAVPGVQSAGVISKLPLIPDARQDSALFVEDRPLTPGTIPNVHQMAFTSPGYFEAMGVRILEGRPFDEPDLARVRHEVIVSRSVAQRYWPRDRAIGKRVRMAPFGAWYTIVGVAEDVRGTALDQPPDEIVYLPVIVALGPRSNDVAPTALWSPRDIAFVARTAGDPSTIASRVEAAVRSIDPTVPAFGSRLMADVVSGAAARTTLTLMLLGIASVVALALGSVGIYGVISYVVSLRTREIAVRLALGARPSDVRRMVSRQAGALVVTGIALGLGAAAATTRLMAALLFGVDPGDPATMLLAALLLALVAVAASWIPAYRASGVDPAQALRSD